MKQNVNHLFLSVLLAIILTSCTGEIITEADDGATFEYAIGSTFQIRLKGEPDAGFMWKTVGLRNNGVVEEVGEPVIKSKSETGQAYGTYTFTFKTKAAGNTLLRLMYYDKNAEDPKPEDEFEIRISSGTMGRITR
jgi:predicted secreted protein